MTSPFKVIRGTDSNIAEFEKAISDALLAGYELAGDLVVARDAGETFMFQTLFLEEYTFEEEIEEDEEEDEDEEDEEDEDYDDEENDEYLSDSDEYELEDAFDLDLEEDDM